MSEASARAHIDRFNAAVTSGDWSALLATLHPGAVMTFVGVPAGPYAGREAIAEAYATDPPDDTMRVLSVRCDEAADVVAFEWSRGGTGTLTIRRGGGLITGLAIRFD
jgi:steroid Delta-isomerase